MNEYDSLNDDKLFKILKITDKLELVSASSLRGFIFKVTTIEKPQKSYIMKIVVLAPKNFSSSISLTDCTNTVNSLQEQKKLTETEKNFKDESEIQNLIYSESRRGGRNPLCPRVWYSVIYKCNISKDFLSLLNSNNNNNNIEKQTWLGWLRGLNPFMPNPEITSVINCLLYYFTRKFIDANEKEYFFRLGIILMDEIPKCVTFYKFTHDNNNSKNDKNLAYSNVYYQLIYLFLIIGKINFDMHRDNALVYLDNNNIIKTTLIDFGKVDDLNDLNIKYLTVDEKRYINELRMDLRVELHSMIFPKRKRKQKRKYNHMEIQENDLENELDNELENNLENELENELENVFKISKKDKINFIMKTMNILNIICWVVNRRDYNYEIDKPTVHQMHWFKPTQDVIAYMNNTSNRMQYDEDNDGNPIEYEHESIDEDNGKMTNLIDTLMSKKDYTNTDGIPEESFNILATEYPTSDTDLDRYTIPQIEEKGSDCNFDGGSKKTLKTKRKYKTKFYSKSGKKSKIKTKRKSQKKSCRKHKITLIK